MVIMDIAEDLRGVNLWRCRLTIPLLETMKTIIVVPLSNREDECSARLLARGFEQSWGRS